MKSMKGYKNFRDCLNMTIIILCSFNSTKTQKYHLKHVGFMISVSYLSYMVCWNDEVFITKNILPLAACSH